MCQEFTCQGSGKFISFPALAAPDTTIKAQELMISPVKTPASQAAGLGSILDQHLQPVTHPALQGEGKNPSRGTWERKVSIAFKVNFPPSCRASLFSEL